VDVLESPDGNCGSVRAYKFDRIDERVRRPLPLGFSRLTHPKNLTELFEEIRVSLQRVLLFAHRPNLRIVRSFTFSQLMKIRHSIFPQTALILLMLHTCINV